MVHFLGGDGDGKHSGSTSAPGGLKVLSWRADWISILVEGGVVTHRFTYTEKTHTCCQLASALQRMKIAK